MPKLGDASSPGVGDFQQITVYDKVAGFDEPCVLGLELTGLVLSPDKAGKLGNEYLKLEAVNVTDFSDDASTIDLTDAGDGCQCMRDNFGLLLNGLVQNFDLLFQGAHSRDINGHCLIYRVVHGNK